jgi:hypothetical protein
LLDSFNIKGCVITTAGAMGAQKDVVVLICKNGLVMFWC